MTTWHRGELIGKRLRKTEQPLENFLVALKKKPPLRVDGTSIFVTRRSHSTPAVLVHHLQHNKVLSEQVVVLRVETQDVPHLPADDRIEDEP